MTPPSARPENKEFTAPNMSPNSLADVGAGNKVYMTAIETLHNRQPEISSQINAFLFMVTFGNLDLTMTMRCVHLAPELLREVLELDPLVRVGAENKKGLDNTSKPLNYGSYGRT
ncbi:hypothetical protein sS8_1277 [Methylocaldum marinum]|uniref:Uncharacterized protein n=1 Tax=Methylocaldum marinum TaxID=1432792 RepID=A0A250KNS0_9GAMM|nr:hypothetical protein sS8_1277 [Methylocaldum marinum]